jgi:hypothetical protein
MKRGTLFMAAFLSAGLTFGSLLFLVGPQRSGWNHYAHGWHGGWHHHYYNDAPFDHERRQPVDNDQH